MTRRRMTRGRATNLVLVMICIALGLAAVATARDGARDSIRAVPVQIAFTRIVSPLTPSHDDSSHVRIVNGKAERRLTSLRGSTYDPVWSPDGTKIAFTRARGPSNEIYVINSSRSGQRKLTHGGHDPSWSPDGRRIAFTSGPGIWVINADGTGKRRLARNGAGAAWSPDGNWIAFIGDRAMFLIRPDGSGTRRLTQIAEVSNGPIWSPDSTQIGFPSGGAIYVVGLDGHGKRRLTRGPIENDDPAWSPDGRKIAFTRGMYPECDVWVMNANGSRQRRLTMSGEPSGLIPGTAACAHSAALVARREESRLHE